MSYTKRDDVVLDGWTVVELDTGELVAVRCEKVRKEQDQEQAIHYAVQAKVVDAGGVGANDSAGKPIATGYSHVSPLSIVDTLGDGNITRDLLLACLGETTQGAVTLSARNLQAASIRQAIAAAQLVGAADAGAVL